MDLLAFILSMVGLLTWPAVVVVFLLLLKPHLKALAGRIEEMSLPGGIRAKFVKHPEAERE
jgi:hypothetical protein